MMSIEHMPEDFGRIVLGDVVAFTMDHVLVPRFHGKS